MDNLYQSKCQLQPSQKHMKFWAIGIEALFIHLKSKGLLDDYLVEIKGLPLIVIKLRTPFYMVNNELSDIRTMLNFLT